MINKYGAPAPRKYALPTRLAMSAETAKEVHARISVPRVSNTQNRPSIERSTRLIANSIIAGIAPIDGLLRIGSAMVGRAWSALNLDHPFIGALSDGLKTLRAFPGDTQSKLMTLSHIRQHLNDSRTSLDLRNNWIQIEYYILNSLFAWPLLVDKHRSGTDGIGLSLPVFLSADFNAGTSEPQIFGEANGRLKSVASNDGWPRRG
jgi:hypothetical protein